MAIHTDPMIQRQTGQIAHAPFDQLLDRDLGYRNCGDGINRPLGRGRHGSGTPGAAAAGFTTTTPAVYHCTACTPIENRPFQHG
jgi:hypothetical protein